MPPTDDMPHLNQILGGIKICQWRSSVTWDQAKYVSEPTDCLIQKDTCMHEMSRLTALTTRNFLKFDWSNPKSTHLGWVMMYSCPGHTINFVQCQNYSHEWFSEKIIKQAYSSTSSRVHHSPKVSLPLNSKNHCQLWELIWHNLLVISFKSGLQLLQWKEAIKQLRRWKNTAY